MPEASLWAVVLAGGVGARFWPVSTPARPKQLLPLGSERPLVADAVERVLPLVTADRLRVLAGADLGPALAGALGQLPADAFWFEPRTRGTGPVLAWAAARIAREDPDAVMVSLHADHVIRPATAFRDLLVEAASVARRHGRLVTIGVAPDRPETGYGYIRVGGRLDRDVEEGRARRVDAFVEKPNLDTARAFVAGGRHLWNSGIFVWRVADLLEEIERHTPEIAGPLAFAVDEPQRYFDTVRPISIDEGVLERSDRIAVLPADFRWDDVGAWNAVARTRTGDEAGNVVEGAVHAVDASDCIAWTDGEPVVLFGTHDLVVVRANGVTLVAPRDRTPELKRLLDHLPPDLRRTEA